MLPASDNVQAFSCSQGATLVAHRTDGERLPTRTWAPRPGARRRFILGILAACAVPTGLILAASLFEMLTPVRGLPPRSIDGTFCCVVAVCLLESYIAAALVVRATPRGMTITTDSAGLTFKDGSHPRTVRGEEIACVRFVSGNDRMTVRAPDPIPLFLQGYSSADRRALASLVIRQARLFPDSQDFTRFVSQSVVG